MKNVEGWELNKFKNTYMFLPLTAGKGELYFDLESSSSYMHLSLSVSLSLCLSVSLSLSLSMRPSRLLIRQ